MNVQVFPTWSDGCRKLYRRLDSALGQIAEALGEDTTLLLFSSRGMEDNRSDLPSSAILPELMFRYSFPDKSGLISIRPNFRPRLKVRPESSIG